MLIKQVWLVSKWPIERILNATRQKKNILKYPPYLGELGKD